MGTVEVIENSAYTKTDDGHGQGHLKLSCAITDHEHGPGR